MDIMERSLMLFESSVRSKYSLKQYKYNLEKFREFAKVKDYETLASLDSETIQNMLEDYVMMLRERGLTQATIRNYLAAPELFFELNKKTIYKKILHKMIPGKEKGGSDKPYTTQDIQKMLLATASKRDRALIHLYASTGARPKSIEDPVLTFENVHDMPHGCKAVLLYAGSKDEYWSFLTPEASRALQDYVDEREMLGEVITLQSPVFANKYRVKGQKVTPMRFVSAHMKIYHLIKKAGIERVKTGNRFDKAMSYGFRKRFNTILKINNEVNSNITEKLMAHKNGLDGTYLRPTREECFNEFVKAIEGLTIDNSERLGIQNKNLKEERTHLEKERGKVTILEDRLDKMSIILDAIQKKVGN